MAARLNRLLIFSNLLRRSRYLFHRHDERNSIERRPILRDLSVHQPKDSDAVRVDFLRRE